MEQNAVTREAERVLHSIFKRCLQCPDTTPTCPTCKSTEICSLAPKACDYCAYMTCIADPDPPPASQKSNVGAIAGGVIGGIAVIAIVVFCVWRFWIKKRRAQQELEAEEWAEDDIASQKRSTRFNNMQTDASSTQTRGSIAASIISRASNIIQIAYIPGVTNRNGSSHNSILQAHPVPPIPAAFRGSANGQPPKSPLNNEGDTLFFSPRDLRGSTYSGTSSLGSAGNRDTQFTQFSRQSITPSLARSSIASTIYHNDATAEPMPAMPAARVVPRMVSVKNSPLTTPAAQSPASGFVTPNSTFEHAEFAANTPLGKGNGFQIMMPGQSSSSSPPSHVNGTSFAKATQVTVGNGKGKGRFPIARPINDTPLDPITRRMNRTSSPLVERGNETSDDEDMEDHARARRSLLNATQQAANATPPIVQPAESPFFDASETLPTGQGGNQTRLNPYATMASTVGSRGEPRANRGVGGLSAVIEEATRRASSEPSHDGLGGKNDEGPFSNEHAAE